MIIDLLSLVQLNAIKIQKEIYNHYDKHDLEIEGLMLNEFEVDLTLIMEFEEIDIKEVIVFIDGVTVTPEIINQNEAEKFINSIF